MSLFTAIFDPSRDQQVAVWFEGQEISYAEMRDQTLVAAQMLANLRLAEGNRVAILLRDSPEFIASFIAIQSLGLIAVPINLGLRADEQRLILRDSGSRAAILEADICNSLLTDAVPPLQELANVLVVDRDGAAEPASVPGITFTGFQNGPVAALPAVFPAHANRDSPSFFLYTSGSTGDPKGAMHRQADVFYTNETYCRQVLQIQLGDRLFSSSRLPFAYGLGNAFSFPLLNGATTVLCREKPVPEIIDRILTHAKPTIFFGVPVVYSLLLEYHRKTKQLDCSSLRLSVSAGEALPAHLGQEWEDTFGVPVMDAIGSTEMLHMWMSNHEGCVRYGSSGTLLKGYDAKLLNPDGTPTADNAEGSLWVKGRSAALGYWNKPEQTANTFVDGWVRTGDLYRCDADGYWYHVGRSDDCFKSSGQWVSPVEVEGVLLRHPYVNQAAVVEDFDAQGLPCPCAFVVCDAVESEHEGIEAELRKMTKDSLPRFKRPQRYVFAAELPYTATGKIQRFKLRAQLRHEKFSRGGAGRLFREPSQGLLGQS